MLIPDWPFEASPNVAVITLRQILEGSAPILHVTHDEEDGGWQFLTGDAPKEADAKVVALSTIVRIDPSVVDLADLPEGWVAVREASNAPWQRQRKD